MGEMGGLAGRIHERDPYYGGGMTAPVLISIAR